MHLIQVPYAIGKKLWFIDEYYLFDDHEHEEEYDYVFESKVYGYVWESGGITIVDGWASCYALRDVFARPVRSSLEFDGGLSGRAQSRPNISFRPT